jgi:hypothetical protein
MKIANNSHYKKCLSAVRGIDLAANLVFVILIYKIAISPFDEDNLCQAPALRWLFMHSAFSFMLILFFIFESLLMRKSCYCPLKKRRICCTKLVVGFQDYILQPFRLALMLYGHTFAFLSYECKIQIYLIIVGTFFFCFIYLIAMAPSLMSKIYSYICSISQNLIVFCKKQEKIQSRRKRNRPRDQLDIDYSSRNAI